MFDYQRIFRKFTSIPLRYNSDTYYWFVCVIYIIILYIYSTYYSYISNMIYIYYIIYYTYIFDSFQMIHQQSSSILVNPPELDQPPGALLVRRRVELRPPSEMRWRWSSRWALMCLVGVLVDAWMLGYNDVGYDMYRWCWWCYNGVLFYYNGYIYIYIMILVFSSA